MPWIKFSIICANTKNFHSHLTLRGRQFQEKLPKATPLQNVLEEQIDQKSRKYCLKYAGMLSCEVCSSTAGLQMPRDDANTARGNPLQA